jgi:hypothetical protein
MDDSEDALQQYAATERLRQKSGRAQLNGRLLRLRLVVGADEYDRHADAGGR